MSLWLTSDWQEKFELWWKLILSVESIREVDSSNSAVGVDLNSESFYVVGTVSSSGEIRQVELNLVPAFIQSHWHGTDERLNSGGRLIVGGSESSSHALVVQDLNFEGEVFLKVLDDHDQEWELDGKSLLWVKRSIDVVGGHIGTHDLQNRGLNIRIGDSLDVTVSDLLIPNLERLGSISDKKRSEWLFQQKEIILRIYVHNFTVLDRLYLPDGIENGEETALIGGLKHFIYVQI